MRVDGCGLEPTPSKREPGSVAGCRPSTGNKKAAGGHPPAESRFVNSGVHGISGVLCYPGSFLAGG